VLARGAGAGEEFSDRRARVPQERLEHHGRLPRVHLARRRRLRRHVGDEKSAHLRHPARLSTTSHPPPAPARRLSIRFKQGSRSRHQTSPPVLPPGESLSIRPVGVAFVWPIMGKHDAKQKTGST